MKAPFWFATVLVLLPNLILAAGETQSFDSEASAIAAGWTGQNANTIGNSYGFSATHLAGGAGVGEAGGIMARSSVVSYYADLTIGGPYSRINALSASGLLVVTTISKSPPFNGTLSVGHFNHTSPSNAQIGYVLSEDDAGSLRFKAMIAMPDQPALFGNELVLTSLLNSPRHWSYSWNPTGGADGVGSLVVTIDGVGGGSSTIDLPAADASTSLALDAFGICSPALPNPSANSLVQLYIDDVSYAEGVGVPSAPVSSLVTLFLMLCAVCGWLAWRARETALGE